jgi:hypothetical protein
MLESSGHYTDTKILNLNDILNYNFKHTALHNQDINKIIRIKPLGISTEICYKQTSSELPNLTISESSG